MGAIQIELPGPVRQPAAQLAEQQHMSLDRLTVVALVEKPATVFPDDVPEERARRGTHQGFDEFVQGVPDIEPLDFDRLPGGQETDK